ncbi:DUF3871 family protein [Flavobacterium sp. YO12]|uniref:DUF3871 family protein n=1 Tax=Flavobacterium sp. YO12 TaxID=1920029 RepID=UPI00100AEFDF|nr:DUF3871 family protein [Flavobacterium sp. YO12]RXM44909.1 hypothetical protein BOW55_17080 [Flavobacterium sp. YO12]
MDTSIFEISQERELQIKSVIPQSRVLQGNDNIISSSVLYLPKPFIEANTMEVNLSYLKNHCVIPVFSKDNERTIAHQEFIEIVQGCTSRAFPNHVFDKPEIRVSHEIKGRIPEAIQKQAKDLLDHERTQYFERMAFIIRIPSITEIINGNEMSLVIGGVRSYNLENLYSKKSFEKFKFFIGFQVKVCCNLCVSTDGFAEEMRVTSYVELQSKIMEILQNYNAEKHLVQMKELSDCSLTEHQFATLIGRSKLYQYLPKKDKINIPALNFNDGQLNVVAKDYYEDENFGRNSDGDLNLWNMYNLFTKANKSSYIDTFLDRNVNAFDFTKDIVKTLNNNSYHWFLS